MTHPSQPAEHPLADFTPEELQTFYLALCAAEDDEALEAEAYERWLLLDGTGPDDDEAAR